MENMHTDFRVERDKDLYVNWHFFLFLFRLKDVSTVSFI